MLSTEVSLKRECKDMNNPYPKDIFGELSKDDIRKCVEAIEKAGVVPDRFSAYLMRIARFNALWELFKEIEDIYDANRLPNGGFHYRNFWDEVSSLKRRMLEEK